MILRIERKFYRCLLFILSTCFITISSVMVSNVTSPFSRHFCASITRFNRLSYCLLASAGKLKVLKNFTFLLLNIFKRGLLKIKRINFHFIVCRGKKYAKIVELSVPFNFRILKNLPDILAPRLRAVVILISQTLLEIWCMAIESIIGITKAIVLQKWKYEKNKYTPRFFVSHFISCRWKLTTFSFCPVPAITAKKIKR